MQKTKNWENESKCPMKKKCESYAVAPLACVTGDILPRECQLLQNLMVDYCFKVYLSDKEMKELNCKTKCDLCKYSVFCSRDGEQLKMREDRRRVKW